jgi:hypothetical protein
LGAKKGLRLSNGYRWFSWIQVVRARRGSEGLEYWCRGAVCADHGARRHTRALLRCRVPPGSVVHPSVTVSSPRRHCSAPWYEAIFGLTTTDYSLKGSPDRLLCVDNLLHSHSYTVAFSNSPAVAKTESPCRV